MKISLLCPNLSTNCLGRTYLLAKLLSHKYQVEIVGPILGNGIWEPLSQDKSINFKYFRVKHKLFPYFDFLRIIKSINGDIIYAHKPLFTSFGFGIVAKTIFHKKLILDIDDWELGFSLQIFKESRFFQKIKFIIKSIIYPYGIGSIINSFVFEKISFFANTITVSNRFLKKKFGGEIIWHARDENFYNPKNFESKTMRKKYKISNSENIILFMGTIRPHKGIEDLISLMNTKNTKNTALVLVGIDDSTYNQEIVALGKKKLKDHFYFFKTQPFSTVPEFLSMADIVVIPQKKNLSSVGQMPAKIFDAMAMGKTIISTSISDIPEVLNNCGIVVSPDDNLQFSKAIEVMLRDRKKNRELGLKAREEFLQNYSFSAMGKKINNIINKNV